ncbi:MAG: DUF58 domain-containing protein [Planctomycetes bacterium]|nr:DUF58 domain-containing protein [Planctomycetota bacterium]
MPTVPKEILKRVRQIQIRTSHLVNDALAGEYVSVFRGQGMEFQEVREYQPGDEIRTIDWNVTARTGRPFVKRFREERELTVMLLVDASSSGQFGSQGRTKSDLSAEVCAVLAFSAIKNNDKVGLLIFTDRVEKFVPPKKGKQHVLRVIRELLAFQPESPRTDIRLALQYLSQVTTRRCVTFLVSDFISEGYEKALRIANRRHDIIAVRVIDPREMGLPEPEQPPAPLRLLGPAGRWIWGLFQPPAIFELEDAETGETLLVDTRDPNTLRGFGLLSQNQVQQSGEYFRSIGVDSIEIRTDRPYTDILLRFFRMRERRMRA